MAGYFIDLVVEGAQGRLAVECDGDYHDDPEQIGKDMDRERILKRSGWVFWRIRGSEFYFNQENALESLWKKLDDLRIAPGGQDKAAGHSNAKAENVTDSNDASEKNSEDESVFTNQATLFTDTVSNERLEFSSEKLQDAIVAILKQCPNNSCTKKSLTTRVCRYLQVITRGKPRNKLEKRIMRALQELENRQIVEEYVATNIRVRLVRHSWSAGGRTRLR